jgi:hypothetical protein
MRYSAILLVLSGVVIACFTGVRYALDGPSEWAENSFGLDLAFPLVLAAALWAFARRGYTVSLGSLSVSHPEPPAGGRLTLGGVEGFPNATIGCGHSVAPAI